MTVLISFNYEPDDPDDNDPTGLSNDEFDEVTMRLMETMGAANIVIQKAPGG